MRMILLFIVAAFLLAPCVPQTPGETAVDTMTETEIAAGSKLLFSNKDLTNREIYNGAEDSGRKIEEGILHIRTYRTPVPWRADNVQEYQNQGTVI